MEILWPAFGICVIVLFVFYVLAKHWRRVLQHQSRMIRRLGDRVQALEEIGDPAFRRRLNESAPMPLEQVFTISFQLGERFWHDTLFLHEGHSDSVRKFGSSVGSVKLEKWRSHTAATITELLPQSETARWEKRSLDFYPDPSKSDDRIVLWELQLNPARAPVERPALLRLILQRNWVELRGWFPSLDGDNSGNGHRMPNTRNEDVFFHIPLDTDLLADFQTPDPADDGALNGNLAGEDALPLSTRSWRTFYSNRDENAGIEWQLRLHDLRLKAEWERFKILDSRQLPLIRKEASQGAVTKSHSKEL
jgi:hypothetical protein